MEQGEHCLEQKPAYLGADQSHTEAMLKYSPYCLRLLE
jgi:hypothetical protein